MKKIYLLLILVFSSFIVNSENQACIVGSVESITGFDCEDEDIEQYQIDYLTYLDNPVDSKPYKIPVVFHVMEKTNGNYISDQEIIDGLNEANMTFTSVYNDNNGGSQIEFYLAKINESGECFSGIIRHDVGTADYGHTEFDWRGNFQIDPVKYCNIYLLDINGGGGASSSPFWLDCDSEEDGLALFYGSMSDGNNTLAHELGHYLGLYHTFYVDPLTTKCFHCRGYDDPSDASDDLFCYERGDRVCDTEPLYELVAGTSCGQTVSNCAMECSTVDDLGYNIPKNNVMGGYKSCREGFTRGQVIRMYFSLEHYREVLWSWDNPDCNDMTITSDFTFSSGTHSVGNITVKDGAILTIPEDAILRFCDEKSLNIRDGSIVILKGTLTNACGYSWNGVNVNGSGARLIGTGGIIENANLAVAVKNGGYCSMISTMFLNNKWAVEVNFSSNGGSFEDCAFEVNQDFQGDYFSYHMRIISNQKPVKIRGGYFINSFDEGTKTGINSYNGNFSIAPSYDYNKFGDLQGTNRVRFTGFHHAISASNGITLSYKIENSIFENNNIAIYNNEVNSSKITFNEFNINDDQVGVMYHGSTLGIINQENKYIGISDIDNVGVLSKSIGVMNNTIRRNTFENLENGCLANGLNGVGSENPRGLTFLCNTNQSVLIDHAVADDPFTQIDQIRPVQGDYVDVSEIDATGNIIHYDNAIASDFFNDGDIQIDYHSRDIVNERLVTQVFVNEIYEDKISCDQSTFIDFPPIIADPHDPHFPTDLIGMKEYLDSINGGTGTGGPGTGGPGPGGPNIGPDITFVQEEWDYFLPFVLNEVMILNQDVGYTNFTNPNQFILHPHDLNVVSWLHNHSLESDLAIVRILSENGQSTQAAHHLNSLSSTWSNHPQLLAVTFDYLDILNEVGAHRIDELTTTIVNNLVNDYSIIRTDFGKAWIRSIAQLYDIYIPITYTLPLSGQVSPRSVQSNTESYVIPNPFNNSFTFLSPNEGVLRIYDLLGRQVLSTNLEKGENVIDLSKEQSGVYLYNFFENDKITLTGKLIKS